MIKVSKKDAQKIKRLKAKRFIAEPNTPRGEVENYQKKLRGLNAFLNKINKTLANMLAGGASIKKTRNYLADQHDKMTKKYSLASEELASLFVSRVAKQNKKRLESRYASVLNIKDVEFLDTKDIEAIREAAIMDNVQLIKSIPQEHFAKVADALRRNFKGIPQEGAKSVAGRLRNIGNITMRRAEFIARDQTAKVNSALTQATHQAAGNKAYEWSTSKDNRVVGNPSGLYPKPTRGHGNHYKREGDIFYWANPPADGHPGQAYNCRCKARAIIHPKDLVLVV